MKNVAEVFPICYFSATFLKKFKGQHLESNQDPNNKKNLAKNTLDQFYSPLYLQSFSSQPSFLTSFLPGAISSLSFSSCLTNGLLGPFFSGQSNKLLQRCFCNKRKTSTTTKTEFGIIALTSANAEMTSTRAGA